MAARQFLRPILFGGLIAGVLDITYAFVFSYLRSGRPPAFVLQSVASGALGRRAYEGGIRTAALGPAFHFLIALVAAAVYVMASRVLPFLVRHSVVSERRTECVPTLSCTALSYVLTPPPGPGPIQNQCSLVAFSFTCSALGFPSPLSIDTIRSRNLSMEMSEVTLETERLLLRWFRDDDFDQYERLGEKVEGETEVMGHHVLIYGISRDEWRNKREAKEVA